jgi:CBS domain-containing protein
VFRALLERRHDLETATRIAARVGRWVAVALVVTGLFWNVWLVVIGVFVYFGATAEEAATIVHVRLTGNRVGDVMVFDPVVLSPSTTAASARALLRHSPQRALPVVGPDGYEGLVDADGVERGDPHRAVAELITDAPVVAASDDLEECVPLLVASPVRALAVLDPVGRVVGLLRAEDVERMGRSLVEPTDASDRAP